MITIERTEPVAYVDDRRVVLSAKLHWLLTVLGMLDTHPATTELLLSVALDQQEAVPADRQVLYARLSRLRQKLGRNVIRCRPGLGYYLTEPVRFR